GVTAFVVSGTPLNGTTGTVATSAAAGTGLVYTITFYGLSSDPVPLIVANNTTAVGITPLTNTNFQLPVGALTKANAANFTASRLTLPVANTYGGVTTVSSGFLQVSNNASLGAANAPAAQGTNVNSGAGLALNRVTLARETLH